MDIEVPVILHLARTFYEVEPLEDQIVQLDGYSDKNYLIKESGTGNNYVLKVVNPAESDAKLTEIIDELIESAYIRHLSDQDQWFTVPSLIKTVAGRRSATSAVWHKRKSDGEYFNPICNIKLFDFFPGITVMEYVDKRWGTFKAGDLYQHIGRLACKVFILFERKHSLIEPLREARLDFPWQLMTSEPVIEKLANKLLPDRLGDRYAMVKRTLQEYRSVRDELAKRPVFIIHGDFSTKNIMIIPEKPSKLCLIDFQDAQLGHQVNELAILMLYAVLEQNQLHFEEALVKIPRWILQGYASSARGKLLDESELVFIPTMMKLRLVLSLLNGLQSFKNDPTNSYAMHTNQRGWQLLELLIGRPSDEFRDMSSLASATKLADLWRS